MVSEEQGKGKEKGRKGEKANTKWPVGFQEQHDQMKKSSRRDQMKKQGVLWLFRMPCCSLKTLILLLPSLGFRGLFLSHEELVRTLPEDEKARQMVPVTFLDSGTSYKNHELLLKNRK